MTRHPITFSCEGACLFGTLDEAEGTTGLLIVSGGNEIRAGAWNGQAQFAAKISAQGFPVLRFDRRGVGDSEGANQGFRNSATDITAALEAFRDACPQLTRVVGMGNCDAASALMLAGGAGCDGLVLCNPWTIEGDNAPPPPAAIRQRYISKIKQPREVWRLLRGGVNLRKLAGGLRAASGPTPAPTGLAEAMQTGLAQFPGPVAILLADRDRTAQMFAEIWDKNDPRIQWCKDASHSFVESQDWLLEKVLATLA